MSWFDRLRNHSRDDKLSDDIDREVSFHLAERADELMAQGMTTERARSEARRRFGNVGLQKERTRRNDLFVWIDVLRADLRYAIRALRSAPAFALVAILSLGLGIGANTAIFSILNAVLLKSLPVDHPEELVAVMREKNGDEWTNPLWEAIRDRQDMFAGIFAFTETRLSLTNGGEARWVNADWVSGDYFSTLGVRPTAGRLLARADDFRGCPATAVLSHGFWRSEYAGDDRVIGQTINLNGHPFSIVGVADPRFSGVTVGLAPQAYVPLCAQAIVYGSGTLDERSRWYLQIMGRPKAGLSISQINARFATLAPGIAQSTLPANWPADALENYRKAEVSVVPAANGFSDVRNQYKTALYDLMAIVGLVLIVACANVANLLLARATARRREVAVRLALGASRARIARQLITESLFLSTCGALVGLVIASWGSRVLVSLLSRSNQAIALDLSPDGRMLGFTIAVAMLTGIIFGVAPAWQASHVDPHTALKSQGRGLAEGFARLRMGRALVASQIAISLVLIAAAGLLIGSWRRLATLDPGFRRGQILLVSANLHDAPFKPDQRKLVVTEILGRLRALPGVRNAATAAITPVSGGGWNGFIEAPGYTAKSKRDALSWFNAVSSGYFATLGIPIVSGRDFDASDTPTSEKMAIVSESMARQYFGTTNVVGRTFQTDEGPALSPPYRIVGVVGSTKYRSLRDSMSAVVYLPAHESPMDDAVNFTLLSDAPLRLVPSVKQAIAESSPRISLEFTTLEHQLDESMRLMSATASLAGFFGGLAVVLATIGLYGIMAYTVARRRNEIGVRIALGAGRAHVVRMVLGDVGKIIVVGVIIGLALSSAATKLVTSFIYEVRRNDPATLAGSALVLVLVGLLAAALPAWRASRLDPVAALRED
jgi:predicted permease